MKAGGVQTLSEQERSEVQARGSDVVNKIQVRELSQLVDLLDEQVFADEKKPYFILIDGLDEEWVGSRSRIRLIRALLEEIRSLRKIRRVKVVCSMRSDLLEQVFNETRDGGFQEEKYEAYYCHLAWSPADLESMVDKRLNEVFRRKYTGRAVGFKDIFPSTRQTTPMQYMLERTFHRPRDVIAFVNECLQVGSDRPRISWQSIYQAETAYSKKRLRSLFDEWHSLSPSLRFVVEVIRGMPESFTRSQIRKEAFEELSISLHSDSVDDYLSRKFRAAYEDKGSNYSESDLICCALQQLFHVGMIGVKTGEQSPFVWASRQQATMSRGEIKRSTHIKIHKMFWKALEVRTESAIRFKGADGYRE